MKKLFLVSLMMLAGSAWAEWKFVTATTYGGQEVALFVDPDTIKKRGNIRKAWGLSAFMNRNENGALSNRWQQEFDCKEEQLRYLAFSRHSDRFAKGTILHTEDINQKDAPWQPVAPNTIDSEILKYVCSK